MSVLSALSVARRPVAGFAVIGIFWGTFAAHLPALKAALGVSDGLFGILLLGSATGLISAMWIAPRIDRAFGARGMQAAAVFFAAAIVLPALAPTPATFALALVAVGVASGLLDVLMNARVSDLEAATGRSLMNAAHGMFSLSYAIAALVSGVTREAGVPPPLVFAGASCLILVLATGLRMAPAEHDDHAPLPPGSYPLWPILLSGSVVLVAFMSEAMVEAWSALHVERTLGGSPAEGALGPAMLGLTMAVGRFSGQAVAERMSEVRVIVAASLLSAVGALIAASAGVPVTAYLGFAILGLGVSVIGPMGLALVGKLVLPRYRTEAISRAAVMGFSGFFFAPVIMGLVSQVAGLRVAFACVAGLVLLAVPLALALGRYPAATSQRRP